MSLIKIISSFARGMFLGHTHTHAILQLLHCGLIFIAAELSLINDHIILIKISTIYLLWN
jgi:hypothetical protein